MQPAYRASQYITHYSLRLIYQAGKILVTALLLLHDFSIKNSPETAKKLAFDRLLQRLKAQP
jgi:hypothetical protein